MIIFRGHKGKTWNLFIFKLLNGYVNCPDLLSNICFSVSGHTTRQTDTFYVPFHCTLYGKNAPLMKSMHNFNIGKYVYL